MINITNSTKLNCGIFTRDFLSAYGAREFLSFCKEWKFKGYYVKLESGLTQVRFWK